MRRLFPESVFAFDMTTAEEVFEAEEGAKAEEDPPREALPATPPKSPEFPAETATPDLPIFLIILRPFHESLPVTSSLKTESSRED